MILEEYNRALLVVISRARGYYWCYVPMRQLVDCTGMKHAPCQHEACTVPAADHRRIRPGHYRAA